jgi:hypothetical protein
VVRVPNSWSGGHELKIPDRHRTWHNLAGVRSSTLVTPRGISCEMTVCLVALAVWHNTHIPVAPPWCPSHTHTHTHATAATTRSSFPTSSTDGNELKIYFYMLYIAAIFWTNAHHIMTIRMPNKTIKYFSSILYFGKHTHIYLIHYNIHLNIEDNEQNNGVLRRKTVRITND